jgi:hypothetical protein
MLIRGGEGTSRNSQDQRWETEIKQLLRSNLVGTWLVLGILQPSETLGVLSLSLVSRSRFTRIHPFT